MVTHQSHMAPSYGAGASDNGATLCSPKSHWPSVRRTTAPAGNQPPATSRHALAAAKALAAQLGEGSEGALQATKRLLGQVAYTSFDDQLEAEADILAAALGTDEGQARLAARLSGDKPGNKDRQGR